MGPMNRREAIWTGSVALGGLFMLSSGVLVVMGQVLGWVVLAKLLLGDGAYMGSLLCAAT